MVKEKVLRARVSAAGWEAMTALAVEREVPVSQVVREAFAHYLSCPKGGGRRA